MHFHIGDMLLENARLHPEIDRVDRLTLSRVVTTGPSQVDRFSRSCGFEVESVD